MKHLSFLIAPLAALALTACSNNEQFRVNGTIDDNATMNLRVSYSDNGAIRNIVTAARDGKFEFFASARQPSIVVISDYDNRPLARIYAANGETFDIKIDRRKPYGVEVEGNDVSRRWAEFLSDNGADIATGKGNEIIAKYISAHPDDLLSTLLLISDYDSSSDVFAADSLLSLIDAKARPTSLTDSYTFMLERLVSDKANARVAPFRFINADTARTFRPFDHKASLLAFTSEDDEGYKKLAEMLERQAKKDRKTFVADLRTDPTSVSYEGVDTFARVRGRLPGGITAAGVEQLGIPSLPFFIVIDRKGSQLYRGNDSGAAFHKLDSLSKTD